MFVKIPYIDIPENVNALKGIRNGKSVFTWLRVQVDETNIVEAMTRLEKSPGVACFDYIGQLEALPLNLPTGLVVVEREVMALDTGAALQADAISPQVRLVFKLPGNFYDLRQVEQFVQQYPNVRISGGYFIRLPGVKFAAIDNDDLIKKVPENRIRRVIKYDTAVLESITLADMEEYEFLYLKPIEEKVKTPRVSVAKESKVSLPKAVKEQKAKAPKQNKRLASLQAILNPVKKEEEANMV